MGHLSAAVRGAFYLNESGGPHIGVYSMTPTFLRSTFAGCRSTGAVTSGPL